MLRRGIFPAALLAILGGYVWLVFAATTLPLPSPESPVIFYSNQCRHDLRQLFCIALKKAHSSILCAIYALTDPEILAMFEKKAKEGIPTHIFYDPSASFSLAKHIPHATTLQSIRCHGLMHRKILVLDQAQVLLGTANLTPPSLTQHTNVVIGFYHPELAHFLATATTSPSAASHFSFHIPYPTESEQQAELWLLPDKDHQALGAIIQLIHAATTSIRIAQFTLTHPKLIEALIQAKQRGVHVSVACDFYTARGASLRALSLLQQAQIPIYINKGAQLMHHKWACIDHGTLILGSANWTRAAFAHNQDCFVILYNLKKEQKRCVKRMWKVIKQESEGLALGF